MTGSFIKYLPAILMSAALILPWGVLNADAAKAKPGKTGGRLAMDNQPKEITLTGVVTMSNDGKSYIIKVSAGFSGKLWFLPESKFRYNEFEMLEVQAVCMVRGGTILSVKTMQAKDKTAYEANLARIREEEAKKAAQQKKKN